MNTVTLKSESPTLIERFDQLVAEVNDIEKTIAAEKKKADDKYDEIEKLVEKHGSMPQGATKSLRLEGTSHQATLSYPVKTSIVEARVIRLRDVLKQLGERTLFRKLFIIETTYVLSPRYTERIANLPKPIKALAKRVVSSEPKSPTLKVEPKKAEKKRSKKAAA